MVKTGWYVKRGVRSDRLMCSYMHLTTSCDAVQQATLSTWFYLFWNGWAIDWHTRCVGPGKRIRMHTRSGKQEMASLSVVPNCVAAKMLRATIREGDKRGHQRQKQNRRRSPTVVRSQPYSRGKQKSVRSTRRASQRWNTKLATQVPKTSTSTRVNTKSDCENVPSAWNSARAKSSVSSTLPAPHCTRQHHPEQTQPDNFSKAQTAQLTTTTILARSRHAAPPSHRRPELNCPPDVESQTAVRAPHIVLEHLEHTHKWLHRGATRHELLKRLSRDCTTFTFSVVLCNRPGLITIPAYARTATATATDAQGKVVRELIGRTAKWVHTGAAACQW